MQPPKQPITFTPDKLEKMVKRVSDFRHNMNNHLTLVIGAAELIQRKPETIERMTRCLTDQAKKIEEEVKKFSAEFEQDLRSREG